MKSPKILWAAGLLLSFNALTAQASLFDRGGGLLYDDVLNVTWLQDANYAHTSVYAQADGAGRMDWATATDWAANLVYGGYSDWRLATNTPVSGDTSFNYGGNGYDGTTDYSYNITSPHSELAYMYNVNLSLKNYYSTTGAVQPNFGIFGDGTYDFFRQNNVGLVNNLHSDGYWSGTYAWFFDARDGYQYSWSTDRLFYAWAVRPGDVSAIPVPGAVWLFSSGLLGLLGFKKRKAV